MKAKFQFGALWKEMSKLKRIAIIMTVTVVVGGLGAKVFYHRIVHANDAKNACIRNLTWIDGAKKIAAKERRLKPGAIISQRELEMYVIDGWRSCPAGGTYTISPIGMEPMCSISDHRMPK